MYAAHPASHRYAFSFTEKYQLEYVNYLERTEHGYYDENGQVRLELIAKRSLDPIVERSKAAAIPKLDGIRRNKKHYNKTKFFPRSQ